MDIRGDKYIMKKVRVVSLARDMLTSPPLHPNQISIYLNRRVFVMIINKQGECTHGDFTAI